jgi:arylsulfatase A-like enzyme
VVLITIDALRGDQPWTGYTLAKTPVLSEFAERGIVYTRNYAIANTTGPAISGLLAVRYPTETDRDNCPLAGFTIGEGVGPVLSSAGVWTGAAHGHAYFGGSTAPKGGFEDWRVIDNVGGKMATRGAVTGPEVTELMLALLKDAPTDKPSFLWAHYLEPHDSYVYHKDFPPSSDPRRGVYDGEVAFVDDQIGKVLAAIDASDMKDRTAVIVSADHGEAFGEHERYRHGFTVFEEEVRVPLMLRIPGQAAKRIEVPRSSMDIPRTIAALLNVPAPARWRGHSLLEDLGTAPPPQRPVIIDVPELMNLPALQAVVMDKIKVIKSGPKWIVYDLEADPKEKNPLSRKEAEAWIEKAKPVLDSLETVPHQPCKRQAFKE